MATSTHVPGTAHHGPHTTGSRSMRRRERLKMSLPLEVRPFDARFADVVDVGEVIDFTRDGLYFATCMPHYFVGMRLLVTFPFGEKDLGPQEISRLGCARGRSPERQRGSRRPIRSVDRGPRVNECHFASRRKAANPASISRTRQKLQYARKIRVLLPPISLLVSINR